MAEQVHDGEQSVADRAGALVGRAGIIKNPDAHNTSNDKLHSYSDNENSLAHLEVRGNRRTTSDVRILGDGSLAVNRSVMLHNEKFGSITVTVGTDGSMSGTTDKLKKPDVPRNGDPASDFVTLPIPQEAAQATVDTVMANLEVAVAIREANSDEAINAHIQELLADPTLEAAQQQVQAA